MLASAALLLALSSAPASSFVNPFVGTDGHGHAFPGATMPFGMVQLSPDTRDDTWDGSSGYHWSDSKILGFSHTHLSGTGVGCLGDVLVMPFTAAVPDGAEPNASSTFSHGDEEASPGYYKVFLKDPQVIAELTATERVGIHRYAFPSSATQRVLVNLQHGISNGPIEANLRVENPTTISGYRVSNGWGGRRAAFFVMQFSRPLHTSNLSEDGKAVGDSAKGKSVKAWFDFGESEKPLLVKVGISGTGVDGARRNLQQEVPGWDFDGVRRSAEKAWDKALDKVHVETASTEDKRTFYTNLYLSYLAPALFNDVDGSYMGLDHKVHRDPGFQNYTTFSLWDTYRALHPLLTLFEPDRVGDMVNSLLAEYDESGLHTTPIWPLWGNETWCMIGYHSVPVIVDAYFKKLGKLDAERAYQAMRDTSMQNYNGLDSYRRLGYVASKGGAQATSKTLEYSFDDWCLAQMASALGHKEDAEMFYRRAYNYRNLFDGKTDFFRGRKESGAWRTPFDTLGLVNDEYTEANAWGYAFAAQQDIPGMISLYGGDKGFVKKLDTMFSMSSEVHSNIPDITGRVGQYAQGNEQCHHIAYLYDYAGQPWKTQSRVRDLMSTFFSDKPDGQCGNVDCGQMSAWYVFSAIGFYPVNPASGVYAIGSPRVDRATLNVGRGKTFTVVAQGNSPTNVYIQSATLNNKPLDRVWLTHAEIVAGGVLKLVMGPRANQRWGSSLSARPPLTMPSSVAPGPVPAPADDKPVKLDLPIRVVCGSDDAVEGFVPDPNMLEGSTNSTRVDVDTSAANAAPAEVYMSERYGSDFTYRFPVPKGKSYLVRLHFAEIFDDSPDMRIEDVLINGIAVLKSFDIYKAAGGINKAVVREFFGVKPDAHGVISIRVKATPESPDQNAKISAIEILPGS